ncbi:hypothetical protein K7X08_012573 [Anisodus acutangulus]|uniref:Peptidyl-prolyl cis-trans isomerase n=1 Tax=Anisodus acutangulus TaxID=402998 RepID=A0A9Q1LAZ5_9SOLA|nr:hypothetical protein K7X08_012573 [Anisodus acutangulus]
MCTQLHGLSSKFLYGEQARFFGDEIHLDLKHSKMGTVAMASAGENLNASQFYITLRDLDYLNGKHTVFGEIAEGQETLNRINEAYVDGKDASPEGKPKDEVEDDVRLEDNWVPMDEQIGMQELEEVLRAKEAHSRAVVIESVGDIPDAELKPPDNVLFVCKLNPVTEDEDLYTIFSRFGTVTSAEIIRDFKTGDSLCYAFIEFEDNEACEQAYFKMDNALIDDRRIHVDFSQSVAKLWSQYRRKDQMGKGKGCYKCGSLDHVAKDCTGDATKQQSNYVLKEEDNKQCGGDGNSRYEMLFDEDATGSPKRNKRGRDLKVKNITRIRILNVGNWTMMEPGRIEKEMDMNAIGRRREVKIPELKRGIMKVGREQLERRKEIIVVETIWSTEETLIMITARLGERDQTMRRDMWIM